MNKSQIEQQLKDLRKEAAELGYCLTAVLQDDTELLVEANLNRNAHAVAVLAMLASCDDLEVESYNYRVSLLVARV